jgi:hypothetical protein
VSEQNEPKTTPASAEHTARDAETQLVLGIFIAVISIPVIIGTLWADTKAAMTVNLIAGIVLLGAGIGLMLVSRRTKSKLTS